MEREGGRRTFVLQGDDDLLEVVKRQIDRLPLHPRDIAGSQVAAAAAAAAAALVVVCLEETFRAWMKGMEGEERKEGGREGRREGGREGGKRFTCEVDEIELAKGGLGRPARHA